jgi:hypothetical protein
VQRATMGDRPRRPQDLASDPHQCIFAIDVVAITRAPKILEQAGFEPSVPLGEWRLRVIRAAAENRVVRQSADFPTAGPTVRILLESMNYWFLSCGQYCFDRPGGNLTGFSNISAAAPRHLPRIIFRGS